MFTAASTLTLADVIRPVKGETPEARMIRLAMKGQIEGCRVIWLPGSGRWVSKVGVTSGSQSGLIYVVDLSERTCTCQSQTICKHICVALDSLDLLPEPPTPAAIAA